MFVLACALFSALYCNGQRTITFEGPPLPPPGTSYLETNYLENGTSLTGFFAPNGGGIPGMPDNGTAYVQGSFGDAASFAFINGTHFGLLLVDLAGYSDVVPDFSATFIGYLAGGSTVTTNFSGTGLNFQTFYFGQEFSGLIRAEIPPDVTGWSLDNLRMGVPEPSSCALLLGGLSVFAFSRATSHFRF